MHISKYINTIKWFNLFYLLLKCNFITIKKTYINIVTLYNISFCMKKYGAKLKLYSNIKLYLNNLEGVKYERKEKILNTQIHGRSRISFNRFNDVLGIKYSRSKRK